jgi:hypothetical protein
MLRSQSEVYKYDVDPRQSLRYHPIPQLLSPIVLRHTPPTFCRSHSKEVFQLPLRSQTKIITMKYLALFLAVLPVAVQAQACAAADRCGSACCRQDGFFIYYCANAARNLCCEEGDIEVGNSGICCRRGFILTGGSKCCPQRSVLCGGECCIGTCSGGRCRTNITDQECQALGRVGACATTPRGRSCDGCDSFGCCTPQIG